MELIKKLKAKYGTNEPIFFEEIAETAGNYTRGRVYQLIKPALESGELVRSEYNCYYIPTQTPFGKSLLNPRKVIEKKYISNNGEIFGYYTGFALLNSFGITTQMPNILEVYTNNEATKARRVEIDNQTVIVKKSRATIDNSNYREMMILELFNLAGAQLKDSDTARKVIDYINQNNIKMRDIIKYADSAPNRAIANFMTSEVPDAIAY